MPTSWNRSGRRRFGTSRTASVRCRSRSRSSSRLLFRLVQKWDMDRTAAHLGTWSASQRYRKETGRDPIGEIREELAAAWGDPSQEREVTWTLRLRVGMITGRGW